MGFCSTCQRTPPRIALNPEGSASSPTGSAASDMSVIGHQAASLRRAERPKPVPEQRPAFRPRVGATPSTSSFPFLTLRNPLGGHAEHPSGAKRMLTMFEYPWGSGRIRIGRSRGPEFGWLVPSAGSEPESWWVAEWSGNPFMLPPFDGGSSTCLLYTSLSYRPADPVRASTSHLGNPTCRTCRRPHFENAKRLRPLAAELQALTLGMVQTPPQQPSHRPRPARSEGPPQPRSTRAK